MGRDAGRAGLLLLCLTTGFAGGLLGWVVAERMGGRAGRPLVGVSPIRPYTEVRYSEPGRPTAEPIVAVVRRVSPAVVAIDTLAREEPGEGFFPFPRGGDVREGQGSGFVINGKERLCVTNNHVVENAVRIRVTFPDRRSFPATIVGRDPIGDIALLRLGSGERPGPLPEIAFGDSDTVDIGQAVLAIGNPLGFEHTVTQGVLSATGRRLEGSRRGIPLDDLLQTDAAINPGNSGGPLLDAAGRVIGMSTAIISDAQGIGFAVAANRIKKAVRDILEHGRVIRPWIGVSMVDLDPDLARRLSLPEPDRPGVAIRGLIQGQPAEKAGLRQWDVIRSAAGKPVESTDDLRKIIVDHEVGDTLELNGLRAGSEKAWRVRIGEMPLPEER